LRPYQAATAAIFLLIAAVAMFDTRGGALPDPAGIAPGGLRGGWYPFWSAAIVAAAALFVLYRTLTTPQAAEGAFQGRAAVLDVGRFVLPMIVATILMQEKLLGFYIGSAVFIAYYAGLTARYRWYWAVLAGLLIPLALYLVFEVGFRALFPKSFLYPGLPF
jgi:putative tricarboxylic transport membrane protein